MRYRGRVALQRAWLRAIDRFVCIAWRRRTCTLHIVFGQVTSHFIGTLNKQREYSDSGDGLVSSLHSNPLSPPSKKNSCFLNPHFCMPPLRLRVEKQ